MKALALLAGIVLTGCATVQHMRVGDELKSGGKEIKVSSRPDMTGSGKLVFSPYSVEKVKLGPTTKLKGSAGKVAAGERIKKTYKISWNGGAKKSEVDCARVSMEGQAAFVGSHASTTWSCIVGDEKSPTAKLTTEQQGTGGSDVLGLTTDPEHNGEATIWGTQIAIKSTNAAADGTTSKARTGYHFLINDKIVGAADLGGEWSFWVAKDLDQQTQANVALAAALMLIDSKVQM